LSLFSDSVREAFARIRDPNGVGSKTFIRFFEKQALATANAWDQLASAGAPLPVMAGLPVSIKDLFDVEGSVTTAGSVALKHENPAIGDAPVVARLRAAGAVIIGTTNMTEFALGGQGLNSHYGTPPNPFDRATGRIPGGSSSGAAVSVTDNMSAIGIGSDTAGSVRVPAALCGIVGFKPTARRLPLAGVVPLSPTLDSVGPLAGTVELCALADAVLAGEEPKAPLPVSLVGLRLAVPQTVVLDDLDALVAASFSRALTTLSKAGATIVEIAFPELGELAAANARGTFAVIEGYAWHRDLLQRKRDLYDPKVAARFSNGEKFSAADYIALRRIQAALIESSRRATEVYDAVIMPTVPITAPPIAELENDYQHYLLVGRTVVRNTLIANFLDRCALTVPCHEPGTAPVGLMIMGETMADRRVLSIGLSIKSEIDRAWPSGGQGWAGPPSPGTGL